MSISFASSKEPIVIRKPAKLNTSIDENLIHVDQRNLGQDSARRWPDRQPRGNSEVPLRQEAHYGSDMVGAGRCALQRVLKRMMVNSGVEVSYISSNHPTVRVVAALSAHVSLESIEVEGRVV